MSRSVNKIILVGNVGRDPEVRETRGGVKVVHFSLATNRRTQVDGKEEERTDWHRITAWILPTTTPTRFLPSSRNG